MKAHGGIEIGELGEAIGLIIAIYFLSIKRGEGGVENSLEGIPREERSDEIRGRIAYSIIKPQHATISVDQCVKRVIAVDLVPAAYRSLFPPVVAEFNYVRRIERARTIFQPPRFQRDDERKQETTIRIRASELLTSKQVAKALPFDAEWERQDDYRKTEREK